MGSREMGSSVPGGRWGSHGLDMLLLRLCLFRRFFLDLVVVGVGSSVFSEVCGVELDPLFLLLLFLPRLRGRDLFCNPFGGWEDSTCVAPVSASTPEEEGSESSINSNACNVPGDCGASLSPSDIFLDRPRLR